MRFGVAYYEGMTLLATVISSVLVTASFASLLKAQPCSTFDVASIKVNTSGLGGGYPELAPGGRRFTATNQLVLELIMFAFSVSPRQISGIPSRFSQERFDVEAVCDQPIGKEQLPQMLQMLLAERFHLSIHRELKEQPVYALTLGKGGPRLREASHPGGKPGLRQRGHSFAFTNAEISKLAGVLSQVSGRSVVDKTGLRGQYDFTLSYSPTHGDTGHAGLTASVTSDGLPDSVFTALREQLGLNLEAQKGQVEFIVVDRLDRPTQN
jgi:uncharacterized protein (TIGR03435 family)